MAARPAVPAAGGGPVATVGVAPARALVPVAPSAPEAARAAARRRTAPEPVSTPIAAPSPQPATELVADGDETTTGPSSPPETGGRPPRVTRRRSAAASTARVVRLSGEQAGSELILGDDATGVPTEIQEGDEYVLSFSFNIESMVYGEPGADNVMLRVQRAKPGENRSSRPRSSGRTRSAIPRASVAVSGRAARATAGDRFLSSLAERTWHDVEIDFRASSQGAGLLRRLPRRRAGRRPAAGSA